MARITQFILALATVALFTAAHAAETCTTQSQMQPADRDALKAAAIDISSRIEKNDQTGLRALTIPEYRADFTGIGNLVAGTSARLNGATPQVDQLYLLDATTLKPTAAGTPADAQFFCNLNKTSAETDFSIPQLPAGRYAFAMVWMDAPTPWRLSLLLRAEGSTWQLAGLYPKPLTAGGHDGLWYWQQARTFIAQKESWSAWLYLQEAQALILPANFVSSTHLEKLQGELNEATPPALAGSMSAEAPFVLKAGDGTEYRFTAIAVDDSLGQDKVDVAAHLKVDSVADNAAARKRNIDAMTALLASHPELRKTFHGVWIFAEPPTGTPFATEQAMADIR